MIQIIIILIFVTTNKAKFKTIESLLLIWYMNHNLSLLLDYLCVALN